LVKDDRRKKRENYEKKNFIFRGRNDRCIIEKQIRTRRCLKPSNSRNDGSSGLPRVDQEKEYQQWPPADAEYAFLPEGTGSKIVVPHRGSRRRSPFVFPGPTLLFCIFFVGGEIANCRGRNIGDLWVARNRAGGGIMKRQVARRLEAAMRRLSGLTASVDENKEKSSAGGGSRIPNWGGEKRY